MADEQKDLLGQLAKNDVTINKKAAEKMKGEILTASTSRWLGVGVHEVFIQAVELVQAKTGTMGMKFIVENDEGKGEVTMWLSEGALPYTIKNVSGLVVHSTDADKKDKARTFMANVVSAKELFDIAKDKLIQAQCWLSIRESRDGSTYTDKNGEQRPSLDRNLLSYEPKQTPTQTVAKATGGEVVVDEDILKNIPF
jgi:hypothetical protein